MTEFITRNYGNENFEIIIKTDSKEHYKATENFARWLIDHAKPTFTIEAKPIVRAHWNNDGRCTNCGGHAPFFPWTDEWYDTKFCPHCSAQMDELVSDTNKLNSSEKPNSCDHIAEGGKKENDEKEG